jgi:hypothetical protein
VFRRNGHYEAWTLGSTLHEWGPAKARPLEAYWSEGDVAFVRSRAGRSLQLVTENGAVHTPSSYEALREYFRLEQ